MNDVPSGMCRRGMCHRHIARAVQKRKSMSQGCQGIQSWLAGGDATKKKKQEETTGKEKVVKEAAKKEYADKEAAKTTNADENAAKKKAVEEATTKKTYDELRQQLRSLRIKGAATTEAEALQEEGENQAHTNQF